MVHLSRFFSPQTRPRTARKIAFPSNYSLGKVWDSFRLLAPDF